MTDRDRQQLGPFELRDMADPREADEIVGDWTGPVHVERMSDLCIIAIFGHGDPQYRLTFWIEKPETMPVEVWDQLTEWWEENPGKGPAMAMRMEQG